MNDCVLVDNVTPVSLETELNDVGVCKSWSQSPLLAPVGKLKHTPWEAELAWTQHRCFGIIYESSQLPQSILKLLL